MKEQEDQFGATAAGERHPTRAEQKEDFRRQCVAMSTTKTKDGNIVMCDQSFLDAKDLK